MISDLRAAELCAASYLANATSPKPFVIFDEGKDDGICWGIVQEDDCDVIVLRGSYTNEDWLRDAMARPYMSRRMGPVHHGFYLGMDNAWTDMKKHLRMDAKYVITGHSLGAARAALLTGIMLDDAWPIEARIVFGEPKPGFSTLAEFIRGIPARSYRNGISDAHDLVTDLPFTIAALGLDYVHPVPLTLVSAPPPVDDVTGLFAWHHSSLYVEALKAFSGAQKDA